MSSVGRILRLPSKNGDDRSSPDNQTAPEMSPGASLPVTGAQKDPERKCLQVSVWWIEVSVLGRDALLHLHLCANTDDTSHKSRRLVIEQREGAAWRSRSPAERRLNYRWWCNGFHLSPPLMRSGQMDDVGKTKQHLQHDSIYFLHTLMWLDISAP